LEYVANNGVTLYSEACSVIGTANCRDSLTQSYIERNPDRVLLYSPLAFCTVASSAFSRPVGLVEDPVQILPHDSIIGCCSYDFVLLVNGF